MRCGSCFGGWCSRRRRDRRLKPPFSGAKRCRRHHGLHCRTCCALFDPPRQRCYGVDVERCRWGQKLVECDSCGNTRRQAVKEEAVPGDSGPAALLHPATVQDQIKNGVHAHEKLLKRTRQVVRTEVLVSITTCITSPGRLFGVHVKHAPYKGQEWILILKGCWERDQDRARERTRGGGREKS